MKIIESRNADKIWVKFLKSFFNFDNDLYFCFAYTPPLTSCYTQSLDYDMIQKLEEDVGRFRQVGNVIIGGDFNAKTNTKSDFVIDKMDEHSPIMDIDTYVIDKPQLRANCDKHSVDAQGEALLNLCKNSSLRILNGRTKGDRCGKFTRYPLSLRETPSTLDYIIADIDILHNIMSFMVLSNLGLSDHECLSMSIKLKGCSIPQNTTVPVTKREPFKYANQDEFRLKLNSPSGREKVRQFLVQHAHATDIEKMTADMIEVVTFASRAISKRTNRNNNKKKCIEKKAPWYSPEYKKLKWALNRAVKEYRKDPFNIRNKQNIFSAKKKFKQMCREHSYRNKITCELMSIESKNPTEFWKVIKKMQKWGSNCDSSDNIDPRDWRLHFQKLLNEEVPTPSSLKEELTKLEEEQFFSEYDIRISNSEIEKAVKRLNKKASPGPDNISG